MNTIFVYLHIIKHVITSKYNLYKLHIIHTYKTNDHNSYEITYYIFNKWKQKVEN